MPLYAYLCDSCGPRDLEHPAWRPGAVLGLWPVGPPPLGFRVASSFQPHFNHAVGAPVNNEREFRDKLKKAAEIETEKTGVYHDYQPVDYADRDAFGITDDHLAALEPTLKREADQGRVA